METPKPLTTMEIVRGFGCKEIGDDVLSHRVAPAVPSALWGLTSEFGMGSGGSPTLESPINRDRARVVFFYRAFGRAARCAAARDMA